MNWRMLLTGGFLVGYRTYILGAVAALSAIASWTVGDVATGDMLKAVAEACLGIGMMTLRLGMTSTVGRAVDAMAVADRVSQPLTSLSDFLPILPSEDVLRPVIARAIASHAHKVGEHRVLTSDLAEDIARAVIAHLDPQS
jgi:hypothetical protein